MLWDDIPPERRTDRMSDGWVTTWRGCEAAVAWPDGSLYRRCSSTVLRAHRLCRKHAERAGLIQPTITRREYPHGLDNFVGNLLKRHVWKERPTMTVEEFRRLSVKDLYRIRNAGRVAVAALRVIQATWTDEEIADAFAMRRSAWDTEGDEVACNWVGEGVPV